MNQLSELNEKLHSLVLFRSLLANPAVARLADLLASADRPAVGKIDAYAAFVAELYREGESLSGLLWKHAAADENAYIVKKARGEQASPLWEDCLRRELAILDALSRLRAHELQGLLGLPGDLPSWERGEIDFASAYRERVEKAPLLGYGVFYGNFMFAAEEGRIAPVKTPDPVRLSDLHGYERERQRVIDNTLALLEGRKAANTLLYGDAGTGKSSTVKAVVNEFGGRGLRLIEVKKNQLFGLAPLIEQIGDNPLKFILFIDDLSFSGENEEIGALKAILEGSVSAKTRNTVIYATSNRRHLVTERFSDRGSDDIHRGETIEEQTSLSARFGLSVNFSKPDKQNYLAIVSELAKQAGLALPRDELFLAAERFALERGGRSGRAARQLIDSLERPK